MKTVGILGGGQLGLLLSQSIVRLGGEAIIYDPAPDAPAAKGVRKFINAAWDDRKSLALLFQLSDVVTYEFENVPGSSLLDFVHSKPIFPSAKVLQLTQNRALEKEFLKNSQLPHVNFLVAQDAAQLEGVSEKLSFPIIIKSMTGGYDGKLQRFVESQDELNEIVREFQKQSLNMFPAVLEEAIELYMEVSCITASDQSGQQFSFPVFENEHVNHILDKTLLPARISQKLEHEIVDLAISAAKKLGVVGLLCTEFFIGKTKKNKPSGYQCEEFSIYINEFAPRPHNSGHVTLNACTVSQFDVLARILLNVPLNQPRITAPGYFCMANLLGDLWLSKESNEINLSALKDQQELVDLVLYGKKEARRQRKMGHLVTYASTPELALQSADRIKASLMLE